uniref:Ubiquitin-like domain-containing protein n=1 Tax=Alexandrium monilatum TaxID=311494 RepID=A0A7S4V657_9DINO
MACCVVISTLAGAPHELHLPSGSTVHDLKQVVASCDWGVPQECQRFVGVNAFEPLGETSTVAEGHYNLVVSLDGLYRSLHDPDTAVRLKALQGVSRLRMKGNDDLVGELIERFQDSDCSVREEAVKAVSHVAEKGDQQVLSAICSILLKERQASIRKAAVKAIASIAEKGDRQSAIALIAMLGDVDHDIREAVVGAIASIGKKGDHQSSAALIPFMSHRNRRVRQAALTTFSHVF